MMKNGEMGDTNGIGDQPPIDDSFVSKLNESQDNPKAVRMNIDPDCNVINTEDDTKNDYKKFSKTVTTGKRICF